MTDNGDDEFSKLIAESQADFERDVMSLKTPVKLAAQTSDAPGAVAASEPIAGDPVRSLEGRGKRVWSSHPRSGMR